MIIPLLIVVLLIGIPTVSELRLNVSTLSPHSRPTPPVTDLTYSCDAVACCKPDWTPHPCPSYEDDDDWSPYFAPYSLFVDIHNRVNERFGFQKMVLC